MAINDHIKKEGVVIDRLPGCQFKVRLTKNEHIVTCHLAGKLRQNKIKILIGDKVDVELTPYDISKGIIVWRTK